jgi:membrane-associated protease RseP (regulator of RpoE activity)
MVSFWIYDVWFLVLFSFGVFWFLKDRKKELSREGIIFMWRTQFGVKAIGWFADRFYWLLHRIKYLIIGLGVVLMGAMLWMLGQTTSIYLLHPEITKLVKAPPIAPLIPYFPKLFGMESFFPPFYFTYFIVALAIVAIVHEFSHGIFMKLFGVKIKSTGLVFLGPMLGAFVEEEKSGFEKRSKIEQMTVLGAGVFANVLFALIFYFLYVAFFFSSFAASGYIFTTYGIAAVPIDNVTGFGEVGNLTSVFTDGGTYYLDEGLAIQLESEGKDYIVAYVEAPAVLAGMKGAIIQADDVKIMGHDDLRWFMENKEPGDAVRFVTESKDGEIREYDIVLGEYPGDESKAYLEVGSNNPEPRGFIQKFLGTFMSFKDSSTYYKPTWDGELVYFIYHLLWWVMIINLLVALFNMMPLGMLDGGRFFYLMVLGIFGSEKIAKGAYKVATYLILFMFVLMMFFWFIRIV